MALSADILAMDLFVYHNCWEDSFPLGVSVQTAFTLGTGTNPVTCVLTLIF